MNTPHRLLAAITTVLACVLPASFVQSQYDPHPAGIEYQEDYRNQFHFSPKSEWMNDINALIYADGQYHMLYQWGKAIRHGGYATSPDLLHWEDEGVALIPQESFLPAELRQSGCQSNQRSRSPRPVCVLPRTDQQVDPRFVRERNDALWVG